jgi:arylsulfatase A-like enzyme
VILATLQGRRSEGSRRCSSAFWPAFWLAAALFVIKAFYVPLLDNAPLTLTAWVRDTLIMSGADVLFATGYGLVGQLMLWMAASRPGLQRRMWLGVVIGGAAGVLWGLLSLRLGQVLRMTPTYPLLYLAGDMKNMQSSIQQVMPWKYLALIAGGPIAYSAVVWITALYCEFKRTWVVRSLQILCVVFILFWHHWAREQVEGEWGRQQDARGLAVNPHCASVRSVITALRGGTIKLHESYADSHLDDFRTVAERKNPPGPTPDLARGPRNVIVVIGESISNQHLSLYGSNFKTWPRMEAEAAHGLVFDNFYSHVTNSANSLVALTLSIYPPSSWRQLTVEQPGIPGTSVAELLKTRGYRTAFISGGDFSGQSAFLQNRGYDLIQDAKDSECESLSSWGVEDRCLVDMVLNYIDQDRSRPFYIFSWTGGTHHPYDPAPGWEKLDFLGNDKSWGDVTGDLSRYLNALYETDKQIGRMLDELRRRALADDTLVLITGDHGQAFGRPHKSFLHSGKVYQEDVNIPLLIWNPKLFQNPPRSKVVGGHVDLAPTILDMLGMGPAPSFQGNSLFAHDRPPRAYFYGAMEDYLLGVREGNRKYILNATQGREELYDLSEDPEELRDEAPQNADACKVFRQRLAAWVSSQKRYAAPSARMETE